ncbi:MAG: PAS domain S-box protein, partial [Thermoanaerobaculia bacterium]|nr:PAS domain S-box protein [Thermoanaerobaculia bacterium]
MGRGTAQDPRRWLPASLRGRVALAVCLALLPLFGLALLNSWQERRREIRAAEESAVRLAEVVGVEERRLFDQTRVLLTDLAHRPAVTAATEPECSRILRHTLDHFGRYDNLVSIELDGTVSCIAVPTDEPLDLSDREYFREAVEAVSFTFGSYRLAPLTGEPALVFAYPVQDGEGRVLRVIAAAMDLRRLSRFEKTIEAQLRPRTTVTKIGADGRILALAPFDASRLGSRPVAFEAVEPLLTREAGVVRAEDEAGEPFLYAVARAPYALEAKEVFVLLGIPEAIAFAHIDRFWLQSLVGLLLITLIALTAAWTVSSSTVAMPIDHLREAARRIAAGEVDVELGSVRSIREFRDLADSLEEMAETIEEREEALRRSEAMHRSLVDNAPYAIYTADSEGRFVETNPAFVRLLGYESAEDLAGEEASRHLERPEEHHDLVERLEGDPEVRDVELTWKDRDDSTVLTRGAARSLRDEPGSTAAVEMILEDITEERRLRRELQQAQ